MIRTKQEAEGQMNQGVMEELVDNSGACGGLNCPSGCAGRRSPWMPALGGAYSCPFGTSICAVWNPDVVVVRRKAATDEVAA